VTEKNDKTPTEASQLPRVQGIDGQPPEKVKKAAPVSGGKPHVEPAAT
jgi:hypothetical protein